MATEPDRVELQARLAALGKRITESDHLSTAQSGAPYAASGWSDIVETHGKLMQRIGDERAGASNLARIHADIEALSLSLDGWMKRVDRRFAKD
jgi:hypothetical protein